MSRTPLNQVNKDKRDNFVAAAIADILLNAADESTNKVVLVIPNNNSRTPIAPT